MPMATDSGQVSPPLVGTKENPARDPKSSANAGKGSIGDRALMDALLIVAVSGLLLLFLAYSLRHHNN